MCVCVCVCARVCVCACVCVFKHSILYQNIRKNLNATANVIVNTIAYLQFKF